MVSTVRNGIGRLREKHFCQFVEYEQAGCKLWVDNALCRQLLSLASLHILAADRRKDWRYGCICSLPSDKSGSFVASSHILRNNCLLTQDAEASATVTSPNTGYAVSAAVYDNNLCGVRWVLVWALTGYSVYILYHGQLENR